MIPLQQFIHTIDSIDILVFGGIFFLSLIVLRVTIMLFKLSINKLLGIKTGAFSRTGNGGKRILILGDSTAVGTGASRQEDTIAGRLAQDFPDAEIVNVAKNGSLIFDLKRQIKSVAGQTFDLIIVSSGGNDVWHLTTMSSITETLLFIFPELKAMSNKNIVFLIYNNIGSAPLFPSILRPFLKRRCLKIQNKIQDLADFAQVATIELFNEDRDNPFLKNGRDLFALDGVHPSSAGYALWYRRMWRLMIEKNKKLH